MTKGAPNNLIYGGIIMMVAFGIFAALLYAGVQITGKEPVEAEEEAVGGPGGGGPLEATLVASNLLFDKRTVTVGAGPVTLTIDNRDAGVLHNLAVYTNNRAAEKLGTSETFPGPGTRAFTFTARAGNLFFRCDVHPDTMTGTLSVR